MCHTARFNVVGKVDVRCVLQKVFIHHVHLSADVPKYEIRLEKCNKILNGASC